MVIVKIVILVMVLLIHSLIWFDLVPEYVIIYVSVAYYYPSQLTIDTQVSVVLKADKNVTN